MACIIRTARDERLFPGEGGIDVRGILAAMPSDIPYALEIPRVRKLDLAKPLIAVTNTRKIGKGDMKNTDLLPRIDVDPETYEVRADGELLTCEPASVLPMAQRYFLF